MTDLVRQSMNGDETAPLAFLTYAQAERIVDEILSDEVSEVGRLYSDLEICAADIMKNHAPKAVADEVDAVLKSMIFHRTVGLLGKMAVDTGVMHVPDDDLPCAVYLIEHNEEKGVFLGDCSI